MKAFFPSTFGDINIEQDNQNIILSTVNVTVSEEEALKQIVKNFSKISEKNLPTYENIKIILQDVTLEEVHKFMLKKLKNNKPTLTAIKLKDGKLELVDELKNEHSDKADAAVTTKKPPRGCPMPSITLEKEIKASEVLKVFLTAPQLQDFNIHRSFISTGNHTKHPYLITSRWSPTIREYGQVYDLFDKVRLCTSCQEIPPSEEMLAMKLSVELNELEFLNTPHSL